MPDRRYWIAGAALALGAALLLVWLL